MNSISHTVRQSRFFGSRATRWVAPIVAALLVPAPASAGLDVRARTQSGSSSDAKPEESRLRTEDHRLRVDTREPPSGQGETSLLFDAKRKVLTVVRHDDRTYIEIDEDTARQIQDKMAAAEQQMRAHLDKMPPAQRATIEKMMKSGALPFPKSAEAPPRPKLEAEKTSATETIDGRPCTVYRLSRGDEVNGEVCVASWTAAGVDPSNVAVLEDLSAFQAELTSSMGALGAQEGPFELLEVIDGFPLRMRSLRDGKQTSQTLFEELREVKIEDSVFDVPAEYTRKSLQPNQ